MNGASYSKRWARSKTASQRGWPICQVERDTARYTSGMAFDTAEKSYRAGLRALGVPESETQGLSARRSEFFRSVTREARGQWRLTLRMVSAGSAHLGELLRHPRMRLIGRGASDLTTGARMASFSSSHTLLRPLRQPAWARAIISTVEYERSMMA